MNVSEFASRHLPAIAKRHLIACWDGSVIARGALRKRIHQGSMPSFLIIGCQKCGTTYLYDRLLDHPQMQSSLIKEIRFFSRNYPRGLQWYLAQFPKLQAGMITGEATPEYASHPLVPQRVAAIMPDVKLVMLLRNPIDRAYSHYNHEVRLGFEPLSFEDAVAAEPTRLAGEFAKMITEPGYWSYQHHHYSYVERGIYADQLARWRERFPTNQLLVVPFERFMRDKDTYMQQIAAFIGLHDWIPEESRKYRTLGYQYEPLSDVTRAKLQEVFRPYNDRLFEMIDDDLGWNG